MSAASRVAFTADIYVAAPKPAAISEVFPTTPELVLKALRYCCIGDTFGTGIEMWSREKIVVHWKRVTSEIVYERSGIYAVGLEKGWYSDDTEMSLGLIKALKRQKRLTVEDLVTAFLEVYDAFKKSNGSIARGGYGNFGKIAALDTQDRVKALAAERESNPYKNSNMIGNGSGMRLLPVLLFFKELYPSDVDTLVHNTIIQTIATHNYASALLSNFVFLDTANALLDGTISFEQVIKYALDFLQSERKYPHLLPTEDLLHNALSIASHNAKITLFGDWTQELDLFKKRLALLDTIPAPVDDIGSNIHADITDKMFMMQDDLLEGKIGLPGGANLTLFATLYCWKCSQVDFSRANQDTKEAYFGLIKRCLSIGGDLDTLLAHVVPVSFLAMEKTSGTPFALPKWVIDGCVEADKLPERL